MHVCWSRDKGESGLPPQSYGKLCRQMHILPRKTRLDMFAERFLATSFGQQSGSSVRDYLHTGLQDEHDMVHVQTMCLPISTAASHDQHEQSLALDLSRVNALPGCRSWDRCPMGLV